MGEREIFHDGELAIQRRAGVEETAGRVGAANLFGELPPEFAAFLSQRFFVVVGSVAADGGVWASLLAGQPGFIRVTDATHLELSAEPWAGDPLAETLDAGAAQAGLLAIEANSRARIRVNGSLHRAAPGRLVMDVSEAFGNCPKYIQRRVPTSLLGDRNTGDDGRRSTRIDGGARELIASADTFFIASAHPERGADASHRGGRPGFVRVAADGRSLRFPDYRGNSMFQTLGNLEVNPRAGLLFVDWERGDALALSGRAAVIWDPTEVAVWPRAERLVEVAVDAVRHLPRALPLRWELIEPSRLNPPVPAGADAGDAIEAGDGAEGDAAEVGD